MPDYPLPINGRETTVSAAVEPSLLEALQGPLALRHTQAGCSMGLCGACTVLVDGHAERACSLRLSELGGKTIRTVEGLLAQGTDHPVVAAWRAAGLAQPGPCLCPSGRIMALTGLWQRGELDGRRAAAVAEESICGCGRNGDVLAAVRRLAGTD
ncbi:MAG TPA: 2Fe-2S iron-sulfur cluster-binding protein [Gammaproteobacteria bacterium]|nr:2Fe-2S iron-sulfur cluster-binding protein [Gammaproteobacteria bacterium]